MSFCMRLHQKSIRRVSLIVINEFSNADFILMAETKYDLGCSAGFIFRCRFYGFERQCCKNHEVFVFFLCYDVGPTHQMCSIMRTVLDAIESNFYSHCLKNDIASFGDVLDVNRIIRLRLLHPCISTAILVLTQW